MKNVLFLPHTMGEDSGSHVWFLLPLRCVLSGKLRTRTRTRHAALCCLFNQIPLTDLAGAKRLIYLPRGTATGLSFVKPLCRCASQEGTCSHPSKATRRRAANNTSAKQKPFVITPKVPCNCSFSESETACVASGRVEVTTRRCAATVRFTCTGRAAKNLRHLKSVFHQHWQETKETFESGATLSSAGLGSAQRGSSRRNADPPITPLSSRERVCSVLIGSSRAWFLCSLQNSIRISRLWGRNRRRRSAQCCLKLFLQKFNFVLGSKTSTHTFVHLKIFNFSCDRIIL